MNIFYSYAESGNSVNIQSISDVNTTVNIIIIDSMRNKMSPFI